MSALCFYTLTSDTTWSVVFLLSRLLALILLELLYPHWFVTSDKSICQIQIQKHNLNLKWPTGGAPSQAPKPKSIVPAHRHIVMQPCCESIYLLIVLVHNWRIHSFTSVGVVHICYELTNAVSVLFFLFSSKMYFLPVLPFLFFSAFDTSCLEGARPIREMFYILQSACFKNCSSEGILFTLFILAQWYQKKSLYFVAFIKTNIFTWLYPQSTLLFISCHWFFYVQNQQQSSGWVV